MASARHEGPDSIIAPTKDRVQVTYQVAVYFKLNTDRLRDFHEQLGLQYKAYTTTGWNNLIQDTFRQQIENALQEETRQVDVADLYGNAELLVQLQTGSRRSSRNGSGSARRTVLLRADVPPGRQVRRADLHHQEGRHPAPSVTQAFQDNRTSAIQVQTKQNQIAQRQAEAKAIEALGSDRRPVRHAQGHRVREDQLLGAAQQRRRHAPSADGAPRRTGGSSTTTTTTSPRGQAVERGNDCRDDRPARRFEGSVSAQLGRTLNIPLLNRSSAPTGSIDPEIIESMEKAWQVCTPDLRRYERVFKILA